ncbi:MAG: T9SS type A sorting domain-containing protein [Flavobacteriaceae bacterium]
MRKKITLLLSLLGGVIVAFGQTMNESQGTGSGVSITTGDYNTAYGDSTLTALSSGSMNTALGYKAGHNITTGTEGVYIGYEAGYTDDNGNDNTMIGFRAGYHNTDTDNTFIGNAAGFYNTLGSDNTFIGERAGSRVTTGDDNTFIGAQAGNTSEYIYSTSTAANLGNPTTGSDNTAIGSAAGSKITTGYRNVFVGSDAGYDVTTGGRNTTLGDSAGTDIGVGNGNTMIGQGAGAATEHADYNTFVGAYAGWDNNRTNGTSNANRNTYVGITTGSSNRQGEDNVGMGAFADFGNSGEPATGWEYGYGAGTHTNRSRTTFIGANADVGNNDVTMLGYETKVDGQYGIAIGVFAQLDGATGGIGIGHRSDLTNNADYSIAIGKDVAITEDHAVAIGRLANISKAQSVGLGANTIVENEGAIVIGYGANSMDLIDNTGGDPDATNNIAIGYNATTSAFNSVAIGNAASAAVDNTMVLGGATNPLSVGIGTDTPNALASLTLDDVNKGLLLNRMTTALRTTLGSALTAAEHGMLVYDTEDKAVYVWDGTQWLSATIDTDDQTIDVFQLNGDNLELSLEADGVATQTVDLSGYLDNTDAQDLSLSGTTLSLTNDATTVDLSVLQDGTGTDAQAISLLTNTLSITGNASTVDLSGYLDNTDAQNLSLSGSTLNIDNGTGVDLSSLQDGTGTDSQELALATNTLSISGGVNTVDLSGYLDNTDAQNLSLSGSTLNIDNGTGVDLSSLQDGVGTDNQELSLSSNTLSISGGSNTVDLSGYVNTDSQDLTSATLTGSIIQIDIENGSSVSVDISPLIADLENRVTVLEACACNVLEIGDEEIITMRPVLEQNIPNPFDATSAIGYYVPHNTDQADIVFSNNLGQIVDRITITQKGEGEVKIDASNYASGMYYYTLYLDGKKIDTKKMIVD